MALINCKECAGEVSTKAKACPNCGAKQPRRASLLGIILLFSILAVVIITLQNTTTNPPPHPPETKLQHSSAPAPMDASTANNKMLMECPTLDSECIKPYIFTAAAEACSKAILEQAPSEATFTTQVEARRFETAGYYAQDQVILHGKGIALGDQRRRYFCVYAPFSRQIIKAELLGDAMNAKQSGNRAPKVSETCRADLACWAKKNMADATTACKTAVRKLAAYDVRWNSTFGEIFDSTVWWGRGGYDSGEIIYTGSSAEFKNAFGVWLQMRFTCEYNPSEKSAEAAIIQ